MANDEVIGPRKTMFVLVIVVGCFAVLWPRILSPLVLGPTREQIQPNQFDREAGCCEVIFDSDVAVLELVNEVCSSALGVGTLSQTAAECRKAVNDTCGVDIAVFLKRNENVGKTTKTLVETMQNSNSSCLREHFGVPVYSLGPHLAAKSWDIKDTLKQERATVMRGMGPHPALRERGRAIPPAPPGPPPPARTVTLPPHVRVRSPLSVYYEVEQPPPIPGMRPPLGSPGGPAPAQRSSMGFVMPIYTICIIVFFVYTLSKIMFRRTASPYDPVTPDPQFRRRVFRDDSRTSPDKLGKKEADTIVTAISGLVAEVQQQMEASYAQNQQRQDAQDNARPYTNGTILLNTGPVQIVASEFKEASNEKTPEPVNENETTPEPKETEPTKVYKEPSPEVDEMITEAAVSPKESSPNVEEPIPELEPTIVPKEATYETVVDKASTPEPTVIHKGTESVLEPKESTPEPLIPEQSIPEPIPQFSNTVLKHDIEYESIPSSDLTESGPQAEVLPEPNVVKETIDTTQTSDYRELSPGDIQPTPESKELSPELNEISPEDSEQSPELKEISPEVNEQSLELNDVSLELTETSLEPFPETLLEPEQSPHEPKQDAPVTSSPKETSPEPIEQYLSKPNESLTELEEFSADPTDSETKESEAEMQISDHQALITSEHLDHITDIQSTPDLLDNSHVDNLDDAPIVKRSEESQITEHSSEIDALIELSSDKKGTLELKEPNSQFKESTPDRKVIEEPKSTQIDDNVPVTNQTLLDLEEAIADVEDTIQPEKIPSDLNVEHPKEIVEATDTDNNVSEDEEISKEKEEQSELDNKDLKEDRFVLVRRTPDESYDVTDDDDVENAAVKVVGMETTAHPADGGAWPRDQRPPAPASPPPPRTPHEAPEVQSIYLQTEIPQQSRVLVAQFEEDRAARPARPADHAPLVVSGKMTLSLIQDAPRETPERDPESTLDEFTTASAVTQPAAEKGELESDEEIEEEIEVEEIELEEEEEEEEDDEDVPPPKAAAKK